MNTATNLKTNAELIKYYEARLKKVITDFASKKDSFHFERDQEYIKHAENELLAVKNGRSW